MRPGGPTRTMRSVWLGCCLSLWALPAHAWVAASVGTGCLDRWYTPAVDHVQVTMTTDDAGIGGIAADVVHTALQQALQAWNGLHCSLCYAPGGAGCAPVTCGDNPLGVSLLDGGVAAHTPWGLPCAQSNPDGSCARVQPNGNFVVQVTDKSQWLWSQFAAAQTVLTTNNATGEIIDADILFNLTARADGGKFAFCQDNCQQTPGAYPLCIPLTHELGHVLGLNHSKDSQATMAESAIPGDTYKCVLQPDDVTGICTVYRSICEGAESKPWREASVCAQRAAADVQGDTSGAGDGQTPTPADGCTATARGAPASWWLVLAATAVRLGWGRSRARRT